MLGTVVGFVGVILQRHMKQRLDRRLADEGTNWGARVRVERGSDLLATSSVEPDSEALTGFVFLTDNGLVFEPVNSSKGPSNASRTVFPDWTTIEMNYTNSRSGLKVLFWSVRTPEGDLRFRSADYRLPTWAAPEKTGTLKPR